MVQTLHWQLKPDSQQPYEILLPIPIFLFFLPTAHLKRKAENRNSVTGISHHSALELHDYGSPSFPGEPCHRASVAGSLASPHRTFMSCLTNLPFPHASKLPWAYWGARSHSQDPHLPPASSSCPISGPRSRRQAPLEAALPCSFIIEAWQRLPQHQPLLKCWCGPHHWKGSTAFPAVQEKQGWQGASTLSGLSAASVYAFCQHVVGHIPAGQQWGATNATHPARAAPQLLAPRPDMGHLCLHLESSPFSSPQ